MLLTYRNEVNKNATIKENSNTRIQNTVKNILESLKSNNVSNNLSLNLINVFFIQKLIAFKYCNVFKRRRIKSKLE